MSNEKYQRDERKKFAIVIIITQAYRTIATAHGKKIKVTHVV